jgi:hypothetical protein
MECLQDVPTDLHEARIRRNLPLEELSARTFLNPAILRRIDEGRFDELPAGLYARSYVKSFAAEVGLDPQEALQKVEHLLRDAPDPLPWLRELKGPSTSDRFTTMLERMWAQGTETAASAVAAVAAPPVAAERAEVEPAMWTRWGAAALDASVLFAIHAGLLLLVAWASGVPAVSLLKHAAVAIGTLCAVPTILYFVLFNGIAGKTLGTWLCRLPEMTPHAPLTLDAILRRSVLR